MGRAGRQTKIAKEVIVNVLGSVKVGHGSGMGVELAFCSWPQNQQNASIYNAVVLSGVFALLSTNGSERVRAARSIGKDVVVLWLETRVPTPLSGC